VIADIFSGLGSIPRQETIYQSNFPDGTPNVYFSGFSIILIFLRFVKALCEVRDKSLFFPSFYNHDVHICFHVTAKL
jgi:hypothetical protein